MILKRALMVGEGVSELVLRGLKRILPVWKEKSQALKPFGKVSSPLQSN